MATEVMRKLSRRHSATMQQQLAAPDEVDFKVLEFECTDTKGILGNASRQLRWKVGVGSGAASLEINLSVERNMTGKIGVGLLCGDIQVYPTGSSATAGPKAQAPLLQDLNWKRTFAGTIKHFNNKKGFEVCTSGVTYNSNQWFVATLTDQKSNGTFSAIVYKPVQHDRSEDDPGEDEFVETAYPIVPKENIRYKSSGKPVVIPERVLAVHVPKEDPMKTSVRVDDQQMTVFFCRPTPPQTKGGKSKGNSVELSVNKDRTLVTASVDAARFGSFWGDEVRAAKEDHSKHKHSWCFDVGPFVKHEVLLERVPKGLMSSAMSAMSGGPNNEFRLLVDGQLMVHATPEEIGCSADIWECTFRLAGHKSLEWVVYECDPETHVPLNTQARRETQVPVSFHLAVRCSVSAADLQSATLSIDEMDFHELHAEKLAREDANMAVSPSVLKDTFDLDTPWRTATKPAEIPRVADESLPSFSDLIFDPKRFFVRCCSATPVPSFVTQVGGSPESCGCSSPAPTQAPPPALQSPRAGKAKLGILKTNR